MASKTFWNERYTAESFAYGTAPNVFFAQQLAQLTPGRMLLPCEGEGRNAVYASQLGWETIAIDSSEVGRKKALQLANESGVSVQYILANCSELGYPEHHYDLVGLIYAHLPSSERKTLLQQVVRTLKPNGVLLLEAFSPQQLNYNSGGPKDLDWFYSLESLKEELPGLDWEIALEEEIDLDEGNFHQGKAHVVRLLARKPL